MQENLMEHIAREVNLDPAQVRLNNINDGAMKQQFTDFLRDTGNISFSECSLHRIFYDIFTNRSIYFSHSKEYYERRAQIDEFNKRNRWRKKGIAVAIMNFPVTYLFGTCVYVAIHHGDGTVSVSHGGSEVGQGTPIIETNREKNFRNDSCPNSVFSCSSGIHTKVVQTCARTLGIPIEMVTVHDTNTLISANATFCGGSITSEGACLATQQACEKILARLKPVRDKMPNAPWPDVIETAWLQAIQLTEKHEINLLDFKSYNVMGCACAEIELDVLTGNQQILRVDIVEDTGMSMNPLVDVGQIEGGFMMGVGYWMTERLEYDRRNGELLTNRTWTYKVPGAKDIPIDFRIRFLQHVNKSGMMRAKATGEPAICLSIVVMFALRHGIDAIRSDVSNGNGEKWYRLGMLELFSATTTKSP